MWSGKRNNYQWLVASETSIGVLLKDSPEVVLGKFVVVAAFDSGPIYPDRNELEDGWLVGDKTITSPKVTAISILPYDNNDEWYIFDHPYILNNPEIFVGYGGFTLRPANYLLEEADQTWDRIGIKESVDILTDLQETLWWQIDNHQPESYIFAGDIFIFVTKREDLFSKIKNTFLRISSNISS